MSWFCRCLLGSLGGKFSVLLSGHVHELQLEFNRLLDQLRIVTSGLDSKLIIELRGHGLKLAVVSGGEQKECDGERDHGDQKTKCRQMDAEFHGLFRRRRDDQHFAVRLPRRYAPIIIKHSASVKAKGPARTSESIMPRACTSSSLKKPIAARNRRLARTSESGRPGWATTQVYPARRFRQGDLLESR